MHRFFPEGLNQTITTPRLQEDSPTRLHSAQCVRRLCYTEHSTSRRSTVVYDWTTTTIHHMCICTQKFTMTLHFRFHHLQGRPSMPSMSISPSCVCGSRDIEGTTWSFIQSADFPLEWNTSTANSCYVPRIEQPSKTPLVSNPASMPAAVCLAPLQLSHAGSIVLFLMSAVSDGTMSVYFKCMHLPSRVPPKVRIHPYAYEKFNAWCCLQIWIQIWMKDSFRAESCLHPSYLNFPQTLTKLRNYMLLLATLSANIPRKQLPNKLSHAAYFLPEREHGQIGFSFQTTFSHFSLFGHFIN